MTLRHFKLPGGTDFAIPVDWWDAAGMEEFRCTSKSYYFVHSPEITLIAINQFVPPAASFLAVLPTLGEQVDPVHARLH